MLGDTIAAVKTTLKAIIPDATKFGPDEPAQELALASLAAVWKTCSTMQDHFAARRAKMEEDPTKVPEIPGEDHAEFRQQFIARHPDVVLPHHREPHRKFVERLQRDFLVHGAVNFYEVGEMRTRNEQIAQKSGLSRNAEDLLKVVQIDQPQVAASESQVMDKLHSFFVALEYLNICEFSYKAGPLQYLSDLEEWRHENRGLALLLAADSLSDPQEGLPPQLRSEADLWDVFSCLARAFERGVGQVQTSPAYGLDSAQVLGQETLSLAVRDSTEAFGQSPQEQTAARSPARTAETVED